MESINYYANSNLETYSLIPHYYFQTVPGKTFVSVIGKSNENTCNDWKNKFSFRLPNDRFVVDYRRNHWTFDADGIVENRMFEDIYEYFVFVFTPDKEDMESLNKMIDMAERCPEKIIFCFYSGYNGMLFSDNLYAFLTKIGNDLIGKGCKYFNTVDDIIYYLISQDRLKEKELYEHE